MVKQILADSKGYTNEDWGVDRSHTPFTDNILNFTYPRRFTYPPMDRYGGRTDPRQHVMRYSWYMNAAGAPDELKCKIFPIFLEDVALMWFTRLPPRSISTFEELSKGFLNQFRLHAKKSKNVIDLSGVKQAPGESLKSYLDRFNQAATEVSDPHEQTILMALIDGVDKDTEFGVYLAGKPLLTREVFYEKAHIRLR